MKRAALTEARVLDEGVRLPPDTGEPRRRGPWGSEPQPKITTPCPTCGLGTLFVGNGGHLTCASLSCPQPSVEEALRILTHMAGRMVMALLQSDLATAQQAARNCRVDFDSDGPFIRRWWTE